MADGSAPRQSDDNGEGSAIATGLAIARETHGLSEAEVRRRYKQIKPWRNRLLFSEFLFFRLYDPAIDPTHFIGAYKAARVAYALNRYSPARRIIGNKLYWDAALRGLGFKTPELQATYGISAGPNVPCLTNRDQVRRFLRHRARYPVFAKPAQGQASQFVMALDRYEADRRVLIDWRGEEIETWHLFRALENRFNDKGFLFQSAVRQHPDVEAVIGRAVGCLRYVTINDAQGVGLVGVAWKVPNANSISDAGAVGGLAVSLDRETGVVQKAFSSSDADAREITHHPGTGAKLVGFQIPNWTAMTEQVVQAARVLHHLPIVGWDIAIGPEGPIFIEANSSPSFWAMQVGRSHGIYTPELQDRVEAEIQRQRALYGWWVSRKARLRRNAQLIGGRVGAVFGR